MWSFTLIAKDLIPLYVGSVVNYPISDTNMAIGTIAFFVLGWIGHWIIARYEVVIRRKEQTKKQKIAEKFLPGGVAPFEEEE